jgi:lipopolysaccharide/colanic/teichoic acid biosynthesis glycosyltransferase
MTNTPFSKRALDIALAGVGLILSSPMWGLVAAAVWLEDGTPIFFRQERVGQGGKTFEALKFRSMIRNAESDRALQAVANDPRVTRVGRLMRATALDELPQLWNIFVGDMSFVGPRALRPQEVEVNGNGELLSLDQIPGGRERHQVKPGLTGVAQVFAPRDITRRNKFRYDRLYIRNQSFWFDVRLILLSFWITARGRWEHGGSKF